MLLEKLRVVLPGHEQESPPPLVRYDAMWEPRQVSPVLQSAEKSPLLDLLRCGMDFIIIAIEGASAALK